MFEALGKIITRRPYFFIALWALVIIGAAITGPLLNAHFSAGGFNDPSSQSAVESNSVSQAFEAQYPQSLIVVIKHPRLTISSPEFQAVVNTVADRLAQQPEIGAVASSLNNPNYARPGSSVAFLTVGLRLGETEAQNYVPQLRQLLSGMHELQEYQQSVTGAPALAYDLNKTTQLDLEQAEVIGIPIMLIILLLVFGSGVAAILPLLVGGAAIVAALAVCDALALHLQISLLVSNTVTMLGLGVAVDYALFVVSRFREELVTRPAADAVAAALATAGRAVVASGATVVASLAALALPPIMVLRSIALGGTVVVLLAVLAGVTLLPAVLTVLGQRVNALRIPFTSRRSKKSNGSMWERWTRFILAKPVVSLIAAVLLLGVLTIPVLALQIRVPVAASGILPTDSPSRIGYETLTKSVGAGTFFPVEVILQSNSGPITTTPGLTVIADMTRLLESEPDTAQVISLANWNPAWTEEQNLASIAHFAQLPGTAQQTVAGLVNIGKDATVARILVLPKSGPDEDATYQLVQRIRTDLQSSTPNGYRVLVGGQTAGGLDFDHQVKESIPYVVLLVFSITLIVLFLTFRSVLLPLKALALNTFVTAASLGALVAIFQYGLFFHWGTRGAINSVTPPILFAVLFGLSMDYEVFILSRIKEAYMRTHDNTNSVVEGLTQTAPMVTGAAAIMIAVFGAFSLVQLEIVKELGFGLGVAILLDATVVRTVLVPVTMKLFGDWNWWFPGSRRVRPSHTDTKQALSSITEYTISNDEEDILSVDTAKLPGIPRHDTKNALLTRGGPSSRLLTLGIRSSEPVEEHITRDIPLRLQPDDILIVDGQGDRLSWTNNVYHRKLASILPSLRQQEEIRRFIEKGGTVVTFPANPSVSFSLPFYHDELPEERAHLAYPVEVTGDLAEVSIPPFDWLPKEVWSGLREAYEIFSAEKTHPQKLWKNVGGLLTMTHSTTQIIAIRLGHGTIAVCQTGSLALSSQILQDLKGAASVREVAA